MTIIFTDNEPRGLGYYELDHRAVDVPMPAAMRHIECDTYTCSHCEAVVILNPQRKRARYKCKGCNHHICDGCAAKRLSGERCRTYAQYVDELRERDARQPENSHLILP